ncbi:MAG: ATP-binding protein [Actinomycetota bacterium]
MTVELDISLLPDTMAPARARRAIRTLRGTVPRDRVEDLELLVSELVTNVVQHAGGRETVEWIRMHVAAATGAVRVEISDPGAGTPVQRDPYDGHVSGWGLTFVDRLSTRWGIDEDQGKTVWFELDTAGAERGESPSSGRSGSDLRLG